MAEPLRPTASSTHGKENWIWVPTIAVITAPTAAEINTASGLDITLVVFATTGQPDQATARVTAEMRLGDTSVPERLGSSTYTGGTMIYAFDPQGAPASSGKKLWELFGSGADVITAGFLVRRLGVARATTPVATNKVSVYPAEVGPSWETKAGDGASGEAAAKCEFGITSRPAQNVAIV